MLTACNIIVIADCDRLQPFFNIWMAVLRAFYKDNDKYALNIDLKSLILQ